MIIYEVFSDYLGEAEYHPTKHEAFRAASWLVQAFGGRVVVEEIVTIPPTQRGICDMLNGRGFVLERRELP